MTTAAGRTRTLEGPEVLTTLGVALDDLLEDTGAPMTARRPWLEVWIRSFPAWGPLAVVVEGPDGRLDAAALLATARSRGLTRVVGLGHGPSDYLRLPARDQEAAVRLGRAVARALNALRGPWVLLVEQLPAGDPAARAIATHLSHAVVEPGDGAPHCRFEEDRSVERYVSKNGRQSERTAWNKLRREGIAAAITSHRTRRQVEAILPWMMETRRSRDRALGRRPDLDRPEVARFFRDVQLALVDRGELEVRTLELDGEAVSYVLVLLDGAAARMWDGRFHPAWGAYSAGRLVDMAAFHGARLDPSIAEYDWMRGEEDYKLRSSTEVVPAEHLVAWSSAAVRVLTRIPGRVRSGLRRMKEGSPKLRRAWRALKRATIARDR